MPIEVSGSEAVVVLECVDEVESTSCAVVCATGRVDVGRKEELNGVDRMEVDVVKVQDLVKLDALVVDGSQSSVSNLCQERNALQTSLSCWQSDARECAGIESFADDGRVA
jgi:hypothetical protein